MFYCPPKLDDDPKWLHQVKKIVSQPPRNLRNCLVAPEVWDFDKAGVEPQRWCHVCCDLGCFMVVVPSEMIPILPNSSAVFSEKLIWLWISSHLRLVVACSFEFHQIPMNDLNQIRTLEGSTHNSQYWENDEPEDLVLSYFRIFGETHIEIKAKLPLNYHLTLPRLAQDMILRGWLDYHSFEVPHMLFISTSFYGVL